MSERQQLEQAIAVLETQRSILGDAIVDASIGALQARLQKLEDTPRQTRKQVTVLFADLSGFTAFSEKMDAEDVGDLMNALWERLDAVIERYGGQIDKHIGDAVMAMWGVRNSREDDTERAIRAALDMQKEILHLREHSAILLGMRIGLASGLAILGEMGSQHEFTAVGDVVNAATELESAAPIGSVLIGLEAYQQVRGIFDITEQAPVEIHGRGEQMRAFLVHRARPRSFRNPVRGVDGIETHMVGRDLELKTLQQTFRHVVAQKQLGCVSVLAEAGLGKSRLLHEFQRWVDSLPLSVQILKARAEEQSISLPFGMLRILLADFFNIHEDDSLVDVHARMEAGLIDHFGAEGVEKAHFIGQVLGFDFSGSPYIIPLKDDSSAIYQRATFYLTQLFLSIASRAPLVLLMDDLHWADDSTLALLETVTRECASAPILLALAARPGLEERQPGWGWFTGNLRLSLAPLTQEDSRLLVSEILRKATSIPQNVQDLILKNAEGNPFYLEELVKMMIESGVIVKGESEWQVRGDLLLELQIPSTLTGVLQARLDRLHPDEREVLSRAAVVGRIFWDSAIQFMKEAHTQEESAQILQTLIGKELVFQRSESAIETANEYTFKHAILREVTYEQVLKSRRRVYHRRAADWIAHNCGVRADEYAPVIADHYERAGEFPLAGEWFARAARAAEKSYALEAALGYYHRAIERLESLASPQELYDLYAGAGVVTRARAQLEEAEIYFKKMHSIAENLSDPTRQVLALNHLWAICSTRSRFSDAIALTSQAEQIARNTHPVDQALLAQTIWQRAITHFRLGKYDETMRLGAESLELSKNANARAQIASNYNLLGLICTVQARYAQAIEYESEALKIWRELYHREFEAGLLSNIGEAYRMMGEDLRAIEYYRQAYQIALQIGNVEVQLNSLVNLGQAQLGAGDYDTAVQTLKRCADVRYVRPDFVVETNFSLAQVFLGLHRPALALSHARQALLDIMKIDFPEYQGIAWRVLGQVLSQLGDTIDLPLSEGEGRVSATDCFMEAQRIFREKGLVRDLALTHWYWARHELTLGNKESGRQLWQSARDMLQSLSLESFLKKMDAEQVF